ncbi:hypothetical protein AB0L20_30795, partial [Streptomyces albidoflavus]|uniref:hypothetical protein n=1 Tax=Streptomyces albidoflavus TaxID=1886 RepID=UPI00342B2AB9
MTTGATMVQAYQCVERARRTPLSRVLAGRRGQDCLGVRPGRYGDDPLGRDLERLDGAQRLGQRAG